MIEFTPVEFINSSMLPWETILLTSRVTSEYLRARTEFINSGVTGICGFLNVANYNTVLNFIQKYPQGEYIGMRWKHQEDLMLFKLRHAG